MYALHPSAAQAEELLPLGLLPLGLLPLGLLPLGELLLKPQSCSHSPIVGKPRVKNGNGWHFASIVSLSTHM
jgi:hypothetical protein